MKKTHDHTPSSLRQHLRTLAADYQRVVATLLGRDILVRGTLNWHTRASGRYPGLTRTVNGRVIGRRVRVEHVAWLEPLLARHKAYRQAELQLRRLHARILALAEELRVARLYDYEPQAVEQQYLVKVNREEHDGA